MSDRRVVVTGIGPLTSVGVGRDSFLDGLRKEQTGLTLRKETLDADEWEEFYVHELPETFDMRRIGMHSELVDEMLDEPGVENELDLQYLIAGVHLALTDSGLSYDRQENNIAVILTHEHPGSDRYIVTVIQEVLAAVRGELAGHGLSSAKAVADYIYRRHAKTIYEQQTFMYLYRVCRAFGFHGLSLFINNACASGLYAIEVASQWIKTSSADVVVVSGADNPLRPFKCRWFRELGLYAEDGKIRPFDRKRSGFVLGDGGAGVVLEELRHAVRRRARIYGEYLGGGFYQDAWRVTVPDVDGNLYKRAVERALQRSGIRPDQVELIVPHGVGTNVGDKYEARIVRDIFGGLQRRPLVTAFKPFLGHTLGGSALTETVLLLVTLQTGRIPPTLNVEEQDPELGLNLALKWVEKEVTVALKMANGFAGYNSAAVFRKVTSD